MQTEETGFFFTVLRSERCNVEKQTYFQEHTPFSFFGEKVEIRFLVRSVGHTGYGSRYPFASAVKTMWYLP